MRLISAQEAANKWGITKRRVLTAYYVSIIEIILIKFVYGLCLASLRIAGEVNELKSLYKFVYIMDKYVS